MSNIFDYWEHLSKSTESSTSVEQAADKLLQKPDTLNKSVYTCLHPSHKEPTQHVLGSIEGNIHFLLGYANPLFKAASYHYQMIDPSISEKDAVELCKSIGNPSIVKDSGDLSDEGEVSQHTKKFGASSYTFLSGLTHCQKFNSYYDNSLLSLSYLPIEDKEKSDENIDVTVDTVPDTIKSLCLWVPDITFDEEVYTFVKSTFPGPSSCITLKYEGSEDVYGIIDSNSIKFYNKLGEQTGINIFNKRYIELDLTRNGNTHPSILLNFAEKKLNISTDLVKSYSE